VASGPCLTTLIESFVGTGTLSLGRGYLRWFQRGGLSFNIASGQQDGIGVMPRTAGDAVRLVADRRYDVRLFVAEMGGKAVHPHEC
jgi:hypothetical protein